MMWGLKRTHRKFAAALGLLGVAFYALLLPWHLTSQFSTQLHRAEAGEFAGSMCMSGGSSPVMPATGCPICKGLAAFQLALASPGAVVLPAMPQAVPALVSMRDDVAELAVPRPKSRGPPQLLA
jgi:hypothetical protein